MKNIKYILPIFALGLVFAQDDDDMDAMWDNTVWNEIEDIADEEIQEVDNITARDAITSARRKEGMLVLFPSYLQHSVNANKL